jgi:hypothetical protein
MPGESPVALILFVGGIAFCALLPGLLSRRPRSPGDTVYPLWEGPSARQRLLRVLSAFLSLTGALFLIPWSVALPWMDASSLVLGVLLAGAVAAAALYALKKRARRSQSESRHG